jgi:hypothetical protein
LRNNPKAISKFVLAYPVVFRFRAGLLDELAMLLHQALYEKLGQ